MKYFISLVLTFVFLFFFTTKVFAQNSTQIQPDTLYRARVLSILDTGEIITEVGTNNYQVLKLQILDGNEKGKEITVDYGKDEQLKQNQFANINETLVIVKTTDLNNNSIYQVVDKYRLDQVLPILIFFFLIVIILSQWKGVGSILGMIISLGVVIKFIVPEILKGNNPLFISIIGCLFIMITTIYLAHGFSKKTTIAVISTFITLIGIGIISSLFVKITFLTGLGSEDASSLSFGTTAHIDFRGLLLGGILIGALGVLDDVTTGLSASIFELSKANPNFKFPRLFISGLNIGKEHISSLVNTLVLAYAGASLPIFLTLVLNPNHYPLWSILNDGLIIEEVVRTLAGSIGLVAAVPLTTFLASFYFSKQN